MSLSDSHVRIGIDGFNLALPRGTGVATYARTLSFAAKALGHKIEVVYGLDIAADNPQHDYMEVAFFNALGSNNERRRPKKYSKNWWMDRKREFFLDSAQEIIVSGRVDLRSFESRLPAFDRLINIRFLFESAHKFFKRTKKFMHVKINNPPDIMHWTYPLPLIMEGAKNVYTIHDLVPLRLPYTTLDDKSFYYRLIEEICKTGSDICTVSNSSRNEIISFFPESAARITNTYQSFKPNDRIHKMDNSFMSEEIKSLFGIDPDSYFMFFGSLEPKKNIGRIIEAFLTSKNNAKLVLVGAMAWKTEEELRFIDVGKNSGRIIHIEYLPQYLLMAIVKNARAILFPSLSEGFGLPVLEAMALGAPVLTSAEGALPEVSGDATLCVDAYNVEDIAHGIEKLDKDSELRAYLSHMGPQQAEKFSMDQYKKRLSSFYDKILEE